VNLWDHNRRFYAQAGSAAFTEDLVPSNGTCNADIADAYATIIVAYLRDAVRAGQVDASQPVFIVELAAGTGRFAFLCLRRLATLLAESSVHALDVRYVMTDFTLANLRDWTTHPRLSALAATGRLAFAAFDVEHDCAVVLADGRPLETRNPLVVLANYAFDSIRNDLIRIFDGALFEERIEVNTDGDDLAQVELVESLVPLAPDHFADPAVARLVESYRARGTDLTVAIPTGGLAGLRVLRELAHDRMLLVASDKAITTEAELTAPGATALQFHDGAFSMRVNFHALGQYLAGPFLTTTRPGLVLDTAVGIVGGTADTFADCLSAARSRLDRFGPGEGFELLGRLHELGKINGLSRVLGLDYFLGALRLSHFDPYALARMAARLGEVVDDATPDQQAELEYVLAEVEANTFAGGPDVSDALRTLRRRSR
jgi:hypothetical protein